MNFFIFKFALRSLLFFKGRNITVSLVVALSCAILLASFIAGDSLNYSLKKNAENRLGKINSYAERTDAAFYGDIFDSVSVLRLKGFAAASSQNGNAANVFGVDGDFFSLSPSGDKISNLKKNEAHINRVLADKLSLKLGDFINLAIFVNDAASVESTFISDETNIKNIRVKISGILDSGDFGDFSLLNTNQPQMNVFLDRKNLCEILEIPHQANLALQSGNAESLKFKRVPELKDLKVHEEGKDILKSKNWFIPNYFDLKIFDGILEKNLSWFVSDFSANSKSAHFGFSISDKSVANGNAEINSELANELNAKIGDEIDIAYYVANDFGKLELQSKKFRISGIYDMEEAKKLKELMPPFAGLTDASECSDWKSKIPIDFAKVKDSDEAYWQKYLYAPKLKISYSDASSIWGGRFGNATACKILDRKKFDAALSQLSPEDLGFNFFTPRNQAFADASNGVDFASLFMGLSFFVILGALVLQSMILSFSLGARREELAEYARMGFKKSLILRLIYCEYFIVSAVGAFLGLGLGLIFSSLVYFALNGVWRDVSAGFSLDFYFSARSFAYAFFASLILSSLTVFFTLKRFFKNVFVGRNSVKHFSFLAFVFFVFLSLILFAASFFFNGLLQKALCSIWILFLLLFALKILLRKNFTMAGRFNFNSFICLSVFRKKSPSFFLILISSFVLYLYFIVAFNKFSVGDLSLKSSPSGGYEYIVETALPASGIEGGRFNILPLKVYDAAGANCLNLNRVESPKIVGLNQNILFERSSFSFDNFDAPITHKDWRALADVLPNGEIPAFADTPALLWSMKKNIGDVLEYKISGKTWRIKIVAATKSTLMQGSLIISAENFLKINPEAGGASMFLCDNMGDDKDALFVNFMRYYPTIQSASEYLQKFDNLQNAYLNIFMQLGFIGIILGLCSAALYLLFNLQANFSEYACLNALGLPRKLIAFALSIEAACLIFAGSFVALFSSFLLFPALSNLFWLILYSLIFSAFIALFLYCLANFILRKIALREEV